MNPDDTDDIFVLINNYSLDKHIEDAAILKFFSASLFQAMALNEFSQETAEETLEIMSECGRNYEPR